MYIQNLIKSNIRNITSFSDKKYRKTLYKPEIN